MIIFLVRHGQTAYNRDDVFRGQTDVPLDETGHKQAMAAGRAIAVRGLGQAVILASPLTRAQQTAQAIAAATGFTMSTEPDLTDMSFGEWEGKRRELVAGEYPDLYHAWKADPSQCSFSGGDSYRDFSDRLTSAYDGIFSGREQTVIIVSHRVVLKVIVCHVLGIGAGGFWSIRIDPASLTTIDHDGDPVITTLNDVCHLQPMTPESL